MIVININRKQSLPTYIKKKLHYSSTKYKNNGPLFNAILRSNAIIQNAVAFFKLTSFKNAPICNKAFCLRMRLYLIAAFLKYF